MLRRAGDACSIAPAIFRDDPARGPDYSATGVRGDPTLATAEKGRAILAGMIDELVDGLRALVAEAGHDARASTSSSSATALPARSRRSHAHDAGARVLMVEKNARRPAASRSARPAACGSATMRRRRSPISSPPMPARRPSPSCARSREGMAELPDSRPAALRGGRRDARRAAVAGELSVARPSTASASPMSTTSPDFDAGARPFRTCAARPPARGCSRSSRRNVRGGRGITVRCGSRAERLLVRDGRDRRHAHRGRARSPRAAASCSPAAASRATRDAAQFWPMQPVLSAAVRVQHRRRHAHGAGRPAPRSGTCGTITAPTASGIPIRPIRSASA